MKDRRFPRFTVPQERALVEALAATLATPWDGPDAAHRAAAAHLRDRLRQPGEGIAGAPEAELRGALAAASRRLADDQLNGTARRSLATLQGLIRAYLPPLDTE